MTGRLTRRAALFAVTGVATAAVPHSAPPAKLPSPPAGEAVRYFDSLTETAVIRLTSLASANLLPGNERRALSSKGRFLVFSSDRSGSLSPNRFDLRSGQITSLAGTSNLHSASLSLDGSGRNLFYLDGERLCQLNLGNKRVQILAESVSDFSVGNSSQELWAIRQGRLVQVGQEKARLENVTSCQVGPSGGACLVTRGPRSAVEKLWIVPGSSAANPVPVTDGPLSQPVWAPGGHSLYFLRDHRLTEFNLEHRTEQVINGNSLIAGFSANADGSVFVTASRSKAQPTINLVLRSPVRELTLCEHRASQPEACLPVFSADSRHVYFNSDFQGKPAIYSVNVERLIEETAG